MTREQADGLRRSSGKPVRRIVAGSALIVAAVVTISVVTGRAGSKTDDVKPYRSKEKLCGECPCGSTMQHQRNVEACIKTLPNGTTVNNGPVKSYFPQNSNIYFSPRAGQVREIGEYELGKMIGVARTYDDNGNYVEDIFDAPDKLGQENLVLKHDKFGEVRTARLRWPTHGDTAIFEGYRAGGSLRCRGEAVNKIRTGEWIWFKKDGTEEKRHTYGPSERVPAMEKTFWVCGYDQTEDGGR